VAGERRWRAARLAGLSHIPALVREAQDRESLELALLENLQRSDLNPVEEAAGYRQLIEEHGFTQETLAQRLGKARPTLANALRLLSLPDSVLAYVRDRKLSAGHARALASLPPDRAARIARAAAAKGLSVRDVERLAAAASPAKTKKAQSGVAASLELSPELADVETKLRFALAARVLVRPARQGGSIEIRYSDDEELQRIVDTICPMDVA
jgi:ParB family chromosome partitioning protein